jgi:anti-sigma factor RsiW
MNCEQRESTIVAYVSGELNESEVAACLAHIDACAHCRAIYESCVCVIDAIARDPMPVPTRAESEALSRALAGLQRTPSREPLPQGLGALMWASLLAFAAVATVLALHVAGYFSLAATVRTIGPAPIALAAVITLIVTSFLPIAVAARRRPLNGMTFRR